MKRLSFFGIYVLVENSFENLNFFFSWLSKKNGILKSKFKTMTTELLSLQEQIDTLKLKLTGDLFTDMDIKDEIHNLEMKINGVKPMDTHIDCVGCGS
jgi:hypothetical protein